MAVTWRLVWMAGPGLTSCGPAVDEQESGKWVELKAGEVLTVELPRRDTLPHWRVLSTGERGILRLHKQVARRGAATTLFEFLALREGQAELALAPHLAAVEDRPSFQLKVQVR